MYICQYSCEISSTVFKINWIEPHTFYTFDSRKNDNIFICKQIPLLLAFAMTIHKSQGITLSSVSVDCQGAFEPGQISVAISRVRSPKDISIFKYKPHPCPAQPPCIYKYYNTTSANTRQGMSCCTEATEEEVLDISYKSNRFGHGWGERNWNRLRLKKNYDEPPVPSLYPFCDFEKDAVFPEELQQIKYCLKAKDPSTQTKKTINNYIHSVGKR